MSGKLICSVDYVQMHAQNNKIGVEYSVTLLEVMNEKAGFSAYFF